MVFVFPRMYEYTAGTGALFVCYIFGGNVWPVLVEETQMMYQRPWEKHPVRLSYPTCQHWGSIPEPQRWKASVRPPKHRHQNKLTSPFQTTKMHIISMYSVTGKAAWKSRFLGASVQWSFWVSTVFWRKPNTCNRFVYSSWFYDTPTQ